MDLFENISKTIHYGMVWYGMAHKNREAIYYPKKPPRPCSKVFPAMIRQYQRRNFKYTSVVSRSRSPHRAVVDWERGGMDHMVETGPCPGYLLWRPHSL